MSETEAILITVDGASRIEGSVRAFPDIDFIDGQTVEKGTTVILNGTVQDHPFTDAERLAISVLQGDQVASLALADEVLMTFHNRE